jgi:hypothetical protein
VYPDCLYPFCTRQKGKRHAVGDADFPADLACLMECYELDDLTLWEAIKNRRKGSPAAVFIGYGVIDLSMLQFEVDFLSLAD